MKNFTNRLKKTIILTSYIDFEISFCDEITEDGYVIAIDGGYDIAQKNHIGVDLLMGDFDSVSTKLPDDIETIHFNPEKDFTDLELALKKSVELGMESVLILGGIGGRLDHTVANIQLLSCYSSSFDSLVMKDGRNKCFILSDRRSRSITIPVEDDSYLSLFSLSEECCGVTIENVKYPLRDHTLTRNFPLGVSNEFKEKDAVLSISDGTLLVVVSKK